MNNSARRFLALNCVLHGHDVLDAFDGDISLFQAAFSFKAEGKARELVDSLNAMQQSTSSLSVLSPLVMPLVSFFRSADYAFVVFPGMAPIYLSTFAVSDRNGEVEPAVRDVVLRAIIRDISYVNTNKDIAIVDGKLLLPKPLEGQIPQAVLDAYTLYTLGPVVKGTFAKPLHAVRDRLTLEGYRPIPVATMINLFKSLVEMGVPGPDYARTTLMIPDYLPVYQKTGTIMELRTGEEGILWMLDVAREDKCKVLPVNYTTVRELLVTGLTDLANLDYVLGGANGGLHVRD